MESTSLPSSSSVARTSDICSRRHSREPMLPATTPPIIYTIDYSDQYFTKPQFIDRFKAAPPDLLHVGKAVPITHLWGPVNLYGGENQYTGGRGNTLNWENIALLTPDDWTTLRQKMTEIQAPTGGRLLSDQSKPGHPI